MHVVYITSSGHSGSTLLDLLISGHSRVVSAGEVKMISRDSHPQRCNCGARGVSQCLFWRQVGEQVSRTIQVELEDLNFSSWNEHDFEAHNLAFFEAVRDQSGCNVIVDSSKNRDRLAALLNCTSFDLTVIHLVRSQFGVVHSYYKKGRPVAPIALRWGQRLRLTRHLLKPHPHLDVRYERLVHRPAEIVGAIMAAVGLEFEPEQLDFASHTRHSFGGNRMRFGHDSKIVHDVSWRSGLTARQKFQIALLTMPVGLPGSTWLYKGLQRMGIR